MNEGLSRAFMYGESVFTTMKTASGKPQYWNLHFERLQRGVEFVFGPFTEGAEWVGLFKHRLETLLENETGEKALRLTVYREQGRGLQFTGLCSIADLKVNTSSFPLETVPGEKMHKLRTCAAITRPPWWPSFLKAGDYLSVILAQKMFLKPGDDDLLFLSPDDTILESPTANVFVVRHNKLFTAPSGRNVLEGIMRRKVLDTGLEFFDEVLETETTMEQLLNADAVFGSNSVKGLFLVGQVDDHVIKYDQGFLNKFEKLRSKVSHEVH